jgi:hypothetical protein
MADTHNDSICSQGVRAMRKYFAILIGLLVFFTGSAIAETATKCGGTFYYKQVRGKKGRKYVRHFLLRKNLTNDKKKVYEKFGYTPHRLRFNGAGKITERWTYYAEGLEFTFDDESSLLEKRVINREDRSVN